MKIDFGPYGNNNEDREIFIRVDDYDTWNMDYTLALIIAPMLKQLSFQKHGIPASVFPVCYSDQLTFEFYDADSADMEIASARWQTVLDEMIWCFGRIIDEGEGGVLEPSDHLRIKEGLALFAKHYGDLWD